MLQTCITYFLLFIIMILFGEFFVRNQPGKKVQLYSYYILIPILLFSFIIGSRYMVGIDYKTYYAEFLKVASGSGKEVFRFELIPASLYKILAPNGFHFSSWFVIMAFFQILFFYKSFINKPISFLLPWAVFFFLLNELSFLTNGVRNFVAVMVFFYSISFIFEKKPIKYILCILLGSLFHRSILIMLPFYWILNREWIKNRWIQLLIVFISIIFSHWILTFLVDSFSSIFSAIGFQYQVSKFSLNNTLMIQLNSGFGRLYHWIVYIIIIFYSTRLKEKYKDVGFNIYYNLFFIYVLLNEVIGLYMLLHRALIYFSFTYFIMLAFLCHYLWQHISKRMNIAIFSFILTFEISIFVFNIVKGNPNLSPFLFFWQA